jgi:hypothetical protein
MARLQGAMAVEVASGELDRARGALARALAGGALGPGYWVARDGAAVTFDGGARIGGPSRGRIELHADGRATWQLELGWAETWRVAQAAVVAAAVSVGAALLWSWLFAASLPLGASAGAGWAVAASLLDRRRARRNLRALLRSLPLLVDERGEQSA